MVPRVQVIRVHNVSLETSVDPNTVHTYVDGRLAPPWTVKPKVELPDSATAGVTETGPLYSPSMCGSDSPRDQSLDSSGNDNASKESSSCRSLKT